MATLVMPLLKWSSPSTIVGLIVSAWVDAIKCFSYWPFAHVGQKCFEASNPAFADYDAKPMVVFTRRTRASFFHAFPTAISRGSWSWRMPMFFRVRAAEIAAMAAASRGTSSSKAGKRNSALSSTNALAQPISLVFFLIGEAQCSQKTEALSCEIKFGDHGG